MTILFDSARPVKPVAFACGLPAEGTFGTFHDTLPTEHRHYAVGVLTPADMARIDAARLDAYHTALEVMPEAEAEEAAGDAAVAMHDALVAEKAARLHAEACERRAGFYSEALDREMAKAFPGRKPFTAADEQWWAAESNRRATDYIVAGPSDAALATARMSAGFPPF
jgi:hypothetical protein